MDKITIYTTPTCAFCRLAKDYFRQNNIAYEEKDVAVDDKAREEMFEKSNQMGVPVIEINGEIVIGFDKNRISGLLGI